METKALEIENLKEQIFELQEDNHSYSLKNIDLKKQIAMLKDGLEYQKDMADVYAKVLREIYDFLENKIDDVENGNFIKASELKQLKNSIPETALRRGE